MSLAFQLLNAMLCIFMAKMDAKVIVIGRPVKHWLNGLIHVVMALIGGFFFSWWIGLAIIFESKLVFDISLNLFRGKSLDYVSPRPASIVDKLEKSIFGKDGLLPKIIYFIVSVILNFL